LTIPKSATGLPNGSAAMVNSRDALAADAT
jgi:hypothetical protein